MGKKGGISDLIQIMVILLVFGMLLLIGYKFISELNNNFQASDVINQRGKDATQTLTNMYPGVLDNGFLLLMIGLCVAAIILAMLVAIHPVFLFLYLVFLPIIIFLGAVFSNIYQKAAETTALADLSSQLIFTSHVLQYLPVIIGVFGFVLAIVLYRTYQHSI